MIKKEKIIKYASINSLGTAIYVIAVASLMYLGSQGAFGTTPSIFVPIAMLMLFVFSAAFTGSLIFGRPVMWYLDGRKKEALLLLIYTLGIFLVVTLIVFLSLLAFFR